MWIFAEMSILIADPFKGKAGTGAVLLQRRSSV
jgi:hypothetical protein